LGLLRRGPVDSGNPPWLVVGLGNPGEKYADTPHNAGARAVERLADELGGRFKPSKHRAIAAEARTDEAKLVLVRPTTFMNESGQAVGPFLRWYRSSADALIVVHDDIDLPLGRLRVKKGGGNGGHHGLDSVSGAVGRDFYRVRIGVGRPSDPRIEPADYVLRALPKQQALQLDEAEALAGKAALSLVSHGLDATMGLYNNK